MSACTLPADRVLVDQPAPGDVAGIDRLHVGQHLGAHIGAEAVGADHEVAFGGAAVGEMRDDAIAALLHALQLLADVIALVRKFFPQHAEHAVPRRERLRTDEVPGHGAGAVERPAHGDIDAEVLARIATGGAQHCAHLFMRDDAGAASDQPDVDAFVDVGLPSGAPQQDGREQAAHGAADHQGAPMVWCVQDRLFPAR